MTNPTLPDIVIPDIPLPTLTIAGSSSSSPSPQPASRFPVRRIFCVGRNYADHVAEMGGNADRDPPVYFTKSPFSVIEAVGQGTSLPYPPRTQNLHHEVELVLALGKGARHIDPSDAMACVHALGVGLDMTRRDLQKAAKTTGAPWDMGKDFDGAAVFGPLTPMADIPLHTLGNHRITLTVNGQTRQDDVLASMIWPMPEIIADVSTYTALHPGDIIMTGTPAGVGPVMPGDVIHAHIDAMSPITITITP